MLQRLEYLITSGFCVTLIIDTSASTSGMSCFAIWERRKRNKTDIKEMQSLAILLDYIPHEE